MNTVVIVQARQGSARLPGKSLRPLAGRPLIDHVLERSRAIPGVDVVVLATTTEARDDGLACHVMRAHPGVVVARGDERDVLGRVLGAALSVDATTVIRVTGDCPLLAPDVAGYVLRAFRDQQPEQLGPYAYGWNDTSRSGYPDGTDVEVMTVDVLIEANEWAVDSRDREHVTPWIRRSRRCMLVKAPTDRTALKLSVDTMDDLERVAAIHQHLRRGDYGLGATIKAAVDAGVWNGQ